MLTNFPINDIFDLSPWVGQRKATFRFKLIDGVTNQVLRDLHPLRDSTPVLSHDSTRTIPRTFQLALGAEDTAAVDAINNRVLPFMVTGDGQEWPLGRYMFADRAQQRFSSGDLGTLSLTDEMFIIDQPIESAFSARVSVSVDPADFGQIAVPLETADQTMKRLLSNVEITLLIAGTQYSSVGSWTPGTSRAQILDNLSVDGDYFSPWMNNNGDLKIIRTFDPAHEVPDFDFDEQNKVIAASIVESDNLVSAPNRIVVISNGASSGVNAAAPVVGIFDVPNSAPHSAFNRGFVIADVRNRQVDSVQQAIIAARSIGLRDTAFELVELSTPPDPRHDGYNTIHWQGKFWLEVGWSMEMVEGGEMRHRLQRIYT